MIEDSDDLPPLQEEFTRFLGACAHEGTQPGLIESWLRNWHDREGMWSNLRTFQHWIERARS